MTKTEARQFLDALALPGPQVSAARRTIGRATRSEAIEIMLSTSGQLLVRRSRPGRNGLQVFEDTINTDGTKNVVQKAYDAAGNLVHFDPKGGTP